MSYDDTEWDVAVGPTFAGSFPLGRYLEYTSSDLEEKLKPVSPTTLSFVCEIPAVFMSELKTHGANVNQEFLTIRVGKVLKARVERGEILYSFVIDHDFGAVPVENRGLFETAFEMGRMELTRTHWAIKRRDLNEALRRVELIAADSDNVVPAAPAASAPLPESVPSALHVIETLEDYVTFVLNLPAAADQEIFYRGHSDSRFRLEPSLFRKNDAGEFKYRQKEETIIRELLTSQAREFSSDQYMLDRLVRMQHYGLPTRLLDITSNPLVALYFCCSEAKFDPDQRELDGEVIILTTKTAEVYFFDSDTVSCIANLSLLTDEEKNRMSTSSAMEAFNGTEECKKLLHFIRREKPYFEGRIAPADLERMVFVRGRNTNERITSQSGAFLMFGKDSVLPETGQSGLDIQRVTVRNKGAILAQLAKLNIKSSTIYPGIEKTTAEIAKKHELSS